MDIINKLDRKTILISLIWLFHISAIIGISLGYQDWFAQKTWLNLIILNLSLFLIFPIYQPKNALAYMSIAALGFLVELLGVNYGWFFGDYQYGDNLGLKIAGTPLLIGLNWAMLVLVTGQIARSFLPKKWMQVSFASGLMLLLDMLMEKVAPVFDFWAFESENVPLSNFIAWFVFALIFQFIVHALNSKGNIRVSYHIYIVQFLFFSYFYGFYL
jgi:putative membrane protein